MQLIDFAERLVARRRSRRPASTGRWSTSPSCGPAPRSTSKPVTREFTDGMRALGLHVVSCYQYGKPGWPNSPSDFTRGFDGGVADARTALRLHGAGRRPRLGADLLQRRRAGRCADLEKHCGAMVSRNQLGVGCRAHRHLRRPRTGRLGDRGRRGRRVEHPGLPVGMADQGMVGASANRRRCCSRPRWSPRPTRAC